MEEIEEIIDMQVKQTFEKMLTYLLVSMGLYDKMCIRDRVSVGLEAIEDIIYDFDQALDKVK